MRSSILFSIIVGILVCGCQSAPKEEAPVEPAAVSENTGDRVGELIEMLKEPAAYSRKTAAMELGEIGDRRAVPALITALGDEDIVSPEAVSWEQVLANYRSTIAGALTKITGEELGTDHAKWQEWYEKNRDK